jgi:hypothetical protein
VDCDEGAFHRIAEVTVSLAALTATCGGQPAAGYGFGSNGRYGQGKHDLHRLIQETFG